LKNDSFIGIIRDAVYKLFLEKGINNVSTRDVTRKLNISRSHIYHYYSDWNSLKIDVLENLLDKDINEYMHVVGNENFATSVDEIIHYIDYLIPNKPSLQWIIYLELWPLSARENEYRNIMKRHLIRWMEIIENIIHRGMECGEFIVLDKSIAARQISSIIDGYSSMLILDYSVEKRSDFLTEIFDLSFRIVKVIP